MPGLLQEFERQLLERVDRLERRVAELEGSGRGELLNVDQAAERLAMSETFIRAAIRDGRLPVTRIGRAVRIAIEDLDALPARCRRTPSSAPLTARERAQRVKIGGGR